jgi:hypothetical protein
MLTALSEADRLKRCPKYAFQKKSQSCEPDIWDSIVREFRPYNVFVNIPYLDEYQSLQALL